MAVVGVITGSGFYQLTRMEKDRRDTINIDGRDVVITRGRVGEHEIVHLGRHGAQNNLLPHQVSHFENMKVMVDSGVDFIIGMTVVGILEPSILPGRPILFDDLYFPENRLSDGRVCTRFQTETYSKGGGHMLWNSVFSSSLCGELRMVMRDSGMDFVDGGAYGHVWGPRFPTRSESKHLLHEGIVAVSQTAGPEPILSAEYKIPYALLGFGVVGPQPSSFNEEIMKENLVEVPEAFTRILHLFLKEGDLSRIVYDQAVLFQFV